MCWDALQQEAQAPPPPPPRPPMRSASWRAATTNSPASSKRRPVPTQLSSVSSPAGAAEWLDSDSTDSDSYSDVSVTSSEEEEDANKQEYNIDGGDNAYQNAMKLEGACIDGESEADDDEVEITSRDGSRDGFSAADVDMYFAVIAEATEDELRAILRDEGLPLLHVRALCVPVAWLT